MHPLHAPILLVLLLIPNTSWRDWRGASSPALQQIMSMSAVALMTARTAETDRITPEAGERTLLTGARMNATGDTSRLDHPALSDNLALSLARAGLQIEPSEGRPSRLLDSLPRQSLAGPRGRFVVEELPGGGDWRSADAEILRRQAEVASAGGALVIASPNPSPAEYDNLDQLTPILIWQPGMRGGLLYSPSTRDLGLITNTDLAPTLAGLADVTLAGPDYGSACSARVEPPESALATIDDVSKHAQRLARAQQYVPYIAGALAALIAVVTLAILRRGSAASKLAKAILVTPLALAFTDEAYVALGISAAFLIYAALQSRRQHAPEDRAAIVGICWLTLLAILGDAVLNKCGLTSSSLLGFTAGEGARYYGLGNEAMGMLVGCAAVITGEWIAASRRALFMAGCALWAFLAAVLGAPNLGAKAGGYIVSLICLAAYAVLFISAHRHHAQRQRLRPGLIVAAAAAAALLLGAFAASALGHGDTSHVSQTFGQAHRFGPGVIISVAVRKVSMDLHLMVHSVWMLVLIACGLGAWLMRGRSVSALWVVAIAACLMLNDAGVVAAALCAVYVWGYAAAVQHRTLAAGSFLPKENAAL